MSLDKLETNISYAKIWHRFDACVIFWVVCEQGIFISPMQFHKYTDGGWL
jgi:hypothetical protein